jgi:hypothetical protein
MTILFFDPGFETLKPKNLTCFCIYYGNDQTQYEQDTAYTATGQPSRLSRRCYDLHPTLQYESIRLIIGCHFSMPNTHHLKYIHSSSPLQQTTNIIALSTESRSSTPARDWALEPYHHLPSHDLTSPHTGWRTLNSVPLTDFDRVVGEAVLHGRNE